jgi:hypothetical protein
MTDPSPLPVLMDDAAGPVIKYPPSVALPRLLTLHEVATALRLSPYTIRSLVRKGRLKPVRICRRLLFCQDEIARLLAEAKR